MAHPQLVAGQGRCSGHGRGAHVLVRAAPRAEQRRRAILFGAGNRDPEIQGRFPVRFDIGRATVQEESALEACINRHDTTVRGFLSEGDR